MRTLTPEQAVRLVLHNVKERNDYKYAFFLGAGCSISSGIPAAGDLAARWMREAKRIKTGDEEGWEGWGKSTYASFRTHPAEAYSDVIEDRFPGHLEQQIEIETVTDVRDPIGFGYITLATLMTHPTFGQQFDVVVTTNFDDLLADALYLFTSRKPRVVAHESLSGFVRPSRTRPLVVKLHGDAHLGPKNSRQQLKELGDGLQAAVSGLLKDRGLIFSGYGGNDEGVAQMLAKLRPDDLPWGIYWINDAEPGPRLKPWLEARNATWVKHRDFDGLMAFFFDHFELEPPDLARISKMESEYRASAARFLAKAGKARGPVASSAAKVGEAINWWTIGREALALESTDPAAAERMYEEGIQLLPGSAPLLGSYAAFLDKHLGEGDRAEIFYRRALEADPENARNLGNYADFLARRGDRAAGAWFWRALDVDRMDARNLGSYAIFLYHRGDDAAEYWFARAIEADPRHAGNLYSYAVFLTLNGDSRAESLYMRAITVDPDNADALGNYAGTLLAGGRVPEGLAVLKQALQALPNEASPVAVECWFYLYAHGPPGRREEALAQLKRLLVKDRMRSPEWDLSANVARAVDNKHRQAEWLRRLALVIKGEAQPFVLEAWAAWRKAPDPT